MRKSKAAEYGSRAYLDGFSEDQCPFNEWRDRSEWLAGFRSEKVHAEEAKSITDLREKRGCTGQLMTCPNAEFNPMFGGVECGACGNYGY